MDLLSLRNTLLLFKALKKERAPEVYFSLVGFEYYVKEYPHFLLDSNFKHIRPQPAIAKEFCNEMFPKKVYLGKWQHAKDGQMIETLGITHIINISDSCDNYLDKSHPNLTYLQLVVADENDKPISNMFEEIYEFIRVNTEQTGSEEPIADVDLE